MQDKLSVADLQGLQTQLLELGRSIKISIEQYRTASAPVELDQNRQGRLSRMDAIQGQAIAQAGVARQQTIIENIESALQRVSAGDYGRCGECDNWIPIARLRFDPTSVNCVGCASKQEAKR